MDQQNNSLVLDSLTQNFLKSFLETNDNRGSSDFIQKRNEFDLNFSGSDTLTLVQQDLGTAMVTNLENPLQISSSFEFFHGIIVQLARRYESSEVQGLPEVWKSLIRKIPIGSGLIPLEIYDGHESQGEQHSATIASSTPHNLDNGPNPIHSYSIQETQVNERHNFPNSNNGSFVIDNMPYSPRTPHEPSKLGFAIFAAIIELVGALSNFALNDSAQAKDSKPLIYIVLFSSTFAFLLTSTALLLHGKRPETANKMQKVAFLFGAFGFLGIVGVHFPPTIMWWFTISAFLACLLLFTIAIFI